MNLSTESVAFGEQNGGLVEELNRMSTENKKLTEMLSVMYANYNALQSHLKELMRKNSDYQLCNSRKRKAESEDNINNIHGINRNHTESTISSDEDSIKRPRESISTKGRVSRVVVRTEKSDNSMVSSGLDIDISRKISHDF